MKILNLILAILFVLFAYWQFNDPDSLLWVLFYLFIAVVSAFAAFAKYHIWTIRGGILVTIIWMGTLVPDFVEWLQMGAPTITGSMKAEAPHIELTREFLGLLIALGVLVFHFFTARKKIRN